jgi:cell division protease FtsH
MTTKALPPADGSYQRPRSGQDIISKRNRWSARIGRFFRAILPWALIVLAIYMFASWMGSNRSNFETGMFLIRMAVQIVFAIFFAIIQFVAIFWFMGRTRMETIRPEDPKSVTFKDYWGQPNLVALVQQWISLLSDRDAFVKMGGKYINGVLLYGPPGTGKTLLAKAMAGEAGIAFISVEGSGFRGMFWGVDVLRMMEFVGKAKKLAREYGACIAYIDEIDAVGMSRGGVMGGQGGMPMMGGLMGMGAGSGALTRLLYEMDGVENKSWSEKLRERWYRFIGKEPLKRNWHVLFMGSTNRPDVLDPALLRPGRFDQKIQVDAPDRTGRREVIKGYLSRVKHDETIDIEAIVEDTPHATPAEIAAAITKDAVRIALFNGRERISQIDIDKALQEQDAGLAQPIEELDPEQRRQIAYHEAGHAVAMHYATPEKRIVRATIVRTSGGLGYALAVDRVEVYAAPLRRFAADIIVSMAGHVATKMFLGEYWTGATGGFGSDFSKIRMRIWQLYQHGYFGPPVMGAENTGSSALPPNAAPLLERFWRMLEEQTEQLLQRHADEVEAIARALLEKGTLSHDEVMALLGDNGWQPSDTAFPRPPARLASPSPLPLPAPVEVAAESVADTTPVAVEVTEQPAPVEAAESRPAPTRMVKPPKPEDFARRKLPPAPEPEKPAEPPKVAEPAKDQ